MAKYKFLMLIGMGVSLGESALALQTYPLIDHQSTTLHISQTGLNRIAVANDRIQQVFGAEGTFDVQSDEEGGQIFLKLTSESYLGSHPSKPSTITLITESGLTQDLRLVPKNIEFQSILFKPDFQSQKTSNEKNGSTDQIQSSISLMKAMLRNESLDGYTKVALNQMAVSSVAKEHLKDLSLTPLFHYHGEHLEGKVYSLTNQGSVSLTLKEQDFALQDDLAISLPRKLIHASETITLYVISRHIPKAKVKSEPAIMGGVQ